MAVAAVARDRAEEVWQNLQKRAREFLAAEEGLVRSARALIEEHGLSAAEVRRRLEEWVGRLKINHGMWSKIRGSEAVVALSDYRDGVERYAEESLTKLAASLPIATRDDIKELSKQLDIIHRKLVALSQQLEGRSPAPRRVAGSPRSHGKPRANKSTREQR